MVDAPSFRPLCSAAEERELRAIAHDVFGEALVVGQAASAFRGHRIRVDCWPTNRGMVMRCALDGQVWHQVVCWSALRIKDLPTLDRHAGAVSRHTERELQFVFQGPSQGAW